MTIRIIYLPSLSFTVFLPILYPFRGLYLRPSFPCSNSKLSYIFTLQTVQFRTLNCHLCKNVNSTRFHGNRVRMTKCTHGQLYIATHTHTYIYVYIYILYNVYICRSQWSRGLQALACWDCGLESHPGHGCLSVVSLVCCQVEVSATDWSLVQRSPTDCGASLCVIKKPRKRGG